MGTAKHVVIAQSGGPTPVINNSLKGILETCMDDPERFGVCYGARHGIEGVLKEELLNLSVQDPADIQRLSHTPAAGVIGTCRYKLKEGHEEDFERILQVFAAHDIGYFFYIGGNDSMDTAAKISTMAEERGMELMVVGVPKTIDNDVGDEAFQLIDHTPGYASCAKYWAMNVLTADQENAGSCPSDPVLVMQAMGRDAGFIPAAARLADPERRMPLQIYMPESGLNMEQMADLVNEELKKSGRCLVVVTESFNVGDIGARHDGFGHVEYGASGSSVQQEVVNYLNRAGLSTRGHARGDRPETDQRRNIFLASTVDMEEAFRVGQQAVEIARSGENGWMATILRAEGTAYRARYDRVSLREVANSERCIPADWIAPSRIDVTDDFLAYAQPLIQGDFPALEMENGLPRFARFQPVFADPVLDRYVPQTYRQ